MDLSLACSESISSTEWMLEVVLNHVWCPQLDLWVCQDWMAKAWSVLTGPCPLPCACATRESHVWASCCSSLSDYWWSPSHLQWRASRGHPCSDLANSGRYNRYRRRVEPSFSTCARYFHQRSRYPRLMMGFRTSRSSFGTQRRQMFSFKDRCRGQRSPWASGTVPLV